MSYVLNRHSPYYNRVTEYAEILIDACPDFMDLSDNERYDTVRRAFDHEDRFILGYVVAMIEEMLETAVAS